MLVRFVFLAAFTVLTAVPLSKASDPPDDPSVSAAVLGARLTAENQLEDAVGVYTEAIAADPRNGDLIAARAALYERLELPALADADYDRAVEAAPGSLKPLESRARRHHKNRRFAEEVRDLTAMIRLDPGNAEHYRSRAAVYDLLNQPEQAIADFTRAIELSTLASDDDKARIARIERCADFFNRADTLYTHGRYEESLADYERAEKDGAPLQPKHGQCLMQLSRWREAQEFFDRMLQPGADLTQTADGLPWLRTTSSEETSPEASNPASNEDVPAYSALRNRALAHAHLKKFQAAEDDLAAAIKMRPDDARAYATATMVRLRSGALGEGRDSALKSLSIDGTQTWVRVNLAHIYLLEGQFEWARSIYLGNHGKPEDDTEDRVRMALDDFAALRADGVDEVPLARMEKLLRETAAPARATPLSRRPTVTP